MKKTLHTIIHPREVGRFVASSFNLSVPVACRLLISGVNEVYRIESDSSRYIARLSRVERYRPHSEDAYRFELEALGFLQSRNMPVVGPVVAENDTPLAVLETPEGKRYCSLFPFAPGKSVYPMDRDQSFTAGAVLAKIHSTLDDFSTDLERFPLEDDYLLERPVRLFERLYEDERPGDCDLLRGVADDCGKRLSGIDSLAGEYGVIHGDYWWGNFRFTAEGGITVFDFDSMGLGRRAYDLACLVAFNRLYGNRMEGDVIDAYFQGYQSVRPLSDDELFLLPYLEKARLIRSIGGWLFYMDTMGQLYFEPRINRALEVLADLYE